MFMIEEKVSYKHFIVILFYDFAKIKSQNLSYTRNMEYQNY